MSFAEEPIILMGPVLPGNLPLAGCWRMRLTGLLCRWIVWNGRLSCRQV